ncbi:MULTISPECIES: DUF1344 domain-containing protein [Hyphomicrobiales]|jgi:hypothetical protein|uniref:DUF1344 domain-containing protein n=1 Tax=Hyphomicrobiales TaxID=356 RepID=UPI0003780321|nr:MULTISPECIES: DUF1344 domain-containing protein [Phyllobacteriaceae]MCX8567921.1 DUF1344 domain-containing protein [Aminobacter sp. MET-1]
MKKLILAASALALMSGAALASSTDGTVAKYNSDVRVITLDNGQSYTIPRDVAVPSIQNGEKVSIQLNSDGDRVTGVLKSL